MISAIGSDVATCPLVRLAPRPAEQAETRDDACRSDDGPERAAGHRRPLDQIEPLPEPDRAGHEEQPSDHASGDGHGIHYDEPDPTVSQAMSANLDGQDD